MLLPINPNTVYRGVDRDPFEPSLQDVQINTEKSNELASPTIWQFCPPGWRQEAYRLYEENLVESEFSNEGLYLINDFEIARLIGDIINKHIDFHEILLISVLPLSVHIIPHSWIDDRLLGYDVAYPGGDYYSAVRNGLLITDTMRDDNLWRSPFQSLINQYGLFPTIGPVFSYIKAFKSNTPSEADSNFVVYRMETTEP